VLDAISRIRDTGVTVLIVEQNASQALAISDRAYVIESGSIVLDGSAADLADDPRVREAYLGV
jgi:branched-chain amino acid transport system ATP-binding protein